MMRFKQFLQEMPYLSTTTKDYKSQKYSKPEKTHFDTDTIKTKKIGNWGNYDIEHGTKQLGKNTLGIFHLRDKKTREIHGEVGGVHEQGGFTVHNTIATKQFSGGMHNFYHHLATNHVNHLVSSRTHTPGGAKIWQKLSQNKDLNFSHETHDGKKLSYDKDHWKNYHLENPDTEDTRFKVTRK